jgi:hypothetical protein
MLAATLSPAWQIHCASTAIEDCRLKRIPYTHPDFDRCYYEQFARNCPGASGSTAAEAPERGKPIYLALAGVCAVLGVGLSIHLLRKKGR